MNCLTWYAAGGANEDVSAAADAQRWTDNPVEPTAASVREPFFSMRGRGQEFQTA